MKYFFWLVGFIVFMAVNSYGQKAEAIISKFDTYSEVKKIDTLLSLAYFPIAKSKMAPNCLVFAQEAKRLSLLQGMQAQYASALELEGVALAGIGQKFAAIDSIKKAVSISKKLKNTSLLAEVHFSLGNVYEANDDMPNAIANYKIANNYFKSLKKHPKKYIAINNLANANFHAGNYSDALTYYLQDVVINKKEENKAALAKNYGNLSLVYKAIKDYNKANFYVQKAITIQKELNKQFNLSISYLSAGNIQRRLAHYDSAFYFNKAALQISEELADTIGVAFAYYNIASVYESKAGYSQAISYYLQSVSIFEKQQFTSKILACYNSLSICYNKLSDYKTGITYSKKAYKLAIELNNIPLLEMVTETLYNTYYEQNNYKQALVYRDLNIAYKDSLLNQEKVKEIAKIETNYEIKSRDSEITLLNKNQEIASIKAKENKRIRSFLIVIAFLFLFIIVFIYNRYKAQQKIKLELAVANEQLKELNVSKNKFFAIIAHDLRNPITAFSNLTSALVDNFKHLSEEQLLNYLSNLKKSSGQVSGLLENLLQWALSQTKTLNVNLKLFDLSEVIQKNIDLLTENAAQKNISISFDTPIKSLAYADQSTIDIVFRNILSNAVKFSHKGSKININTTSTDKEVEIHISDKGIGMTAEEVEMLFDITKDTAQIGTSAEKGSGLGLLLSNEYIKKSKGTIHVISKINDGSTFVITLPKTQLEAA